MNMISMGLKNKNILKIWSYFKTFLRAFILSAECAPTCCCASAECKSIWVL